MKKNSNGIIAMLKIARQHGCKGLDRHRLDEIITWSMLDDNLAPKITDFGLSRLLDQHQTISSPNRVGTL